TGNHNCAVLISYDHVVWKHSHTAAAYGLLPAHKSKPGYRGRRGDARAPHWQIRLKNTGRITEYAIAYQAGNAADLHALAQNVAENPCVGDAHRIDNRNASVRHCFDRGPCGDR